MRRIMVIEYRHKGAYIYVWIDGKRVDKMIEERKAQSENGFEVFHFDFRQALIAGHILTDQGFNIEEIESTQKKMDGF